MWHYVTIIWLCLKFYKYPHTAVEPVCKWNDINHEMLKKDSLFTILLPIFVIKEDKEKVLEFRKKCNQWVGYI